MTKFADTTCSGYRMRSCATACSCRPGPESAAARTEARTGRLLPGDGELPLPELIAALPDQAALAVESPVGGRPAGEQARLAHAALARLLAGAPDSDPADVR